MKINKKTFREIFERFITSLDSLEINSLDDIVRNVGKSISVLSGSPGERVEISLRPSMYGTRAYTLSYISPGTGIPIELRINPIFNYIQTIVKLEEELEGFMPFAEDPYGNIIQSKYFQIPADVELNERLKKLL